MLFVLVNKKNEETIKQTYFPSMLKCEANDLIY